MKCRLIFVALLFYLFSCTGDKNVEEKSKIKSENLKSNKVQPASINQNNIEADSELDQFTQPKTWLIDTIDFDQLEVSDKIVHDKFAIAPFGLNTKPRYSINYDSIISSHYIIENFEKASDIDKRWIYKFDRILTGKSMLLFHKSKNGMVSFDRGVIFDKTILLANGIKIGMSRQEFFRVLRSAKKNGNVIKVDTQDQTYDHIFYFEKDVLVAVKLESIFEG